MGQTSAVEDEPVKKTREKLAGKDKTTDTATREQTKQQGDKGTDQVQENRPGNKGADQATKETDQATREQTGRQGDEGKVDMGELIGRLARVDIT